MKTAHTRLLLPSLLLSLSLHALFLLQQAETPGDGGRRETENNARLDAHLRPQSKTASPPELAPPVVNSPAVASPPSRLPKESRPRPASFSETPPPGPLETQPTQETPTVSPPRTPDTGKGSFAEGEGVRTYRIALARAARSFRNYPQTARETGSGGLVKVRLDINEAGRPQPGILLESSGQDVLDAAALDMLDRAAQQVNVPASLLGQAFQMVIPVEFDPAREKK